MEREREITKNVEREKLQETTERTCSNDLLRHVLFLLTWFLKM